ncbi:MAG: ArsR family transcriptional regulator [Micrococcaceae bacterium]|nr:ArsR family transcriptional regulator [Micrococcaceae bacterium]
MESESLHELAARYREMLRQSVYLMRSLDAEGELSAGQVSTLNMLRSGPMRVSHIARNGGVRVPSATEQIIKLENAGLVTRGQDSQDARVVMVSLTPAGEQTLDQANERRNAVLAALFAALTEHERAAIAAALPALNSLSRVLDGTSQPS